MSSLIGFIDLVFILPPWASFQNVFIWDTETFHTSIPKTPIRRLLNCHDDWITGVAWSNTAPNFLVSQSCVKLSNVRCCPCPVSAKLTFDCIFAVDSKHGLSHETVGHEVNKREAGFPKSHVTGHSHGIQREYTKFNSGSKE